MTSLPCIPDDATAEQARRLLAQTGWREIATGDWSWVLSDKDGARAARVTPFDPAYRMYAEACLEGPANRWSPRIEAVLPLRRDGYVTVMERLRPAPEARAAEFCAALGIRNDSGYAPPPLQAPWEEADDELAALRERIEGLIEAGARQHRLWGGSDIRPGNVMIDAQGQLKLVDPMFVRGPAIIEALAEGRIDLLSDFSRGQLEDFLTIPPFKPGPETDDLRRRLAALPEWARPAEDPARA